MTTLPQTFAAGALLSLALIGPALAESAELTAKLAIARAQASIDLVSKENPGQTRDQSFADAQQRLADARTAVDHNHDREALWFANEAEMLADTTAGAAKLAGLEHTRAEIAHSVDVLTAEIRK
ncbi:MAG: hypothetical protein ACYCZX_01180 [Rhodospirillaceae bacterium]